MHRPCSASLPRGWWVIVLVGLGGLACSGSGSGDLNPVEGKVLHKGQPVKGALVTFHPTGADDLKAIPSTGLTRDDGTFTLTTGQKEGAPAGAYTITIICSEPLPPKEKKAVGLSFDPPETADRFRGAYAEKGASKIKAEVKNGVNKLDPWDLK